MSNARFFSAIALTAVVTGTLVAGLTLSRPAFAYAHPKPEHRAECMENFLPSVLPPQTASATSTAVWMTGQYNNGRSHFIVTPEATEDSAGFLCAW